MNEGPDHAADWLSQETRRRNSGITSHTPRPARETLYSFDFERSGINTSLPVAYWDEYDEPQSDTALARLLDTLLGRLSPRQRQAIELVAVAGLTYGAAAIEMGVTKGTVSGHYRDGIRRLRAAIEQEPWAATLIGPWLRSN